MEILLAKILWLDNSSTSMRYSDVQGGLAGGRINVRLMVMLWRECRRRDGWYGTYILESSLRSFPQQMTVCVGQDPLQPSLDGIYVHKLLYMRLPSWGLNLLQ